MTPELPLRTSVRRVEHTRACSGPGGINCYCCQNGRKEGKPWAKRVNARTLRRRAKIAVKVGLDAVADREALL